MEISRRSLLGSAGAAMAAFRLTACSSPVEADTGAANREALDIRRVGAAVDGRTDDTAAWKRALASSDIVRIPAGTTLVSQIEIPSNKTIVTAGFASIVQQIPGQPVATPIIRIVGSNVSIGSLRGVGNIASDTGEWSHVIQAIADAKSGALSNITIGDIIGHNVRGDVIYLDGRPGHPLSGVKIGKVVADNVLRNGVSVCGGSHIQIASITGSRVGYMHFDIEPEPYNTPVTDVRVGLIKGRHIGVVPATPNAFADGIHLERVDLDPWHSTNSTPAYGPGSKQEHALQVRNCKSLRIDEFKANGFAGQAIRQVYNRGELAEQHIHIARAEITDCCRSESIYFTYILGSGGATRISVDELVTTVTRSGVYAIKYCNETAIGRANVVLGRSTGLFAYCDDAVVGPLNVTGKGLLAVGCNRIVFRGGTASVDSLAYNSRDVRFESVALATTSRPFGGASGNYQDHILVNTTLNGVFHANHRYGR